MKLKFLLLVAALIFSSVAASAGVFQKGEELEYEVSFFGIGIGKIVIISEGEEEYNGRPVYKAKATMDSYSGIPFVDLHAIFNSWMDKSMAFSHKFVGNVKSGENTWNYQKILFNYTKNVMLNERWHEKTIVFSDTIRIGKKKYNDGLSLFFMARNYVDLGRTVNVPTIIDKDTVMTKLNFHGTIKPSEIDAVKYPISTLYFNGQANWTGIYGLSGEFEGWFSSDDAHVPIRAEMNVYVGSVDIELVRWKRPGWTPPRYK
ncbi:MAG: DUF3108 domain-containing protein [Candidatus Kapaibacterium sp.]